MDCSYAVEVTSGHANSLDPEIIYINDTFDRPDDTDIGVNWTEDKSYWNITDGRLTKAQNGYDRMILVNTTLMPQDSTGYVVEVQSRNLHNAIIYGNSTHFYEIRVQDDANKKVRMFRYGDGEATVDSIGIAQNSWSAGDILKVVSIENRSMFAIYQNGRYLGTLEDPENKYSGGCAGIGYSDYYSGDQYDSFSAYKQDQHVTITDNTSIDTQANYTLTRNEKWKDMTIVMNSTITVPEPFELTLDNVTLYFTGDINMINILYVNGGILTTGNNTLIAPLGDYKTQINFVGNSKVKISNSTFKYLGRHASGDYGIRYNGAGGNVSEYSYTNYIRDSTFYGSRSDQTEDCIYALMYLESGLNITGNTFINTSACAPGGTFIQMYEATDTIIDRNVFEGGNISRLGIYTFRTTGTNITNNYFHEIWDYTIDIWGGVDRDVYIANNYILNSQKPIVLNIGINKALVENNIINLYDTARYGTIGWGSNVNNTIYRNNTYYNADDCLGGAGAVNDKQSYNNSVYDLRCYDIRDQGLAVGARNSVFHNIFMESGSTNRVAIDQIYDSGNSNNTYRNITATRFGYGLRLSNTSESRFVDINSTGTIYDIQFLGDNTDNRFMNHYFREDKISYSDDEDIFEPYWYLDINVSTEGENNLDLDVVIINEIDSNKIAINREFENKTVFVTKADGSTYMPLENGSESICILDYTRSRDSWTNYTYTANVYDMGNIWTNVTQIVYQNGTVMQILPLAQVSGIDPNTTWYRQDPDTPNYTVLLSIPANHTRTNISVETESLMNMTVTRWQPDDSGIKLNFTADAFDGENVNFTVCGLDGLVNYLVKKDANNFLTTASGMDGCMVFGNSEWSEHEFTIETAPYLDITSWHTNATNASDSLDTMFLAAVNDSIYFNVTIANSSEVEFNWEINKINQNNNLGSFIFNVPQCMPDMDPSGCIWEIHLLINDTQNEMHKEWAVSNLSVGDAPMIFESFTDGLYNSRDEKDPWGRNMTEWTSRGNTISNMSTYYLKGYKGRNYHLQTESTILYGTWDFYFRYPNGGNNNYGDSVSIWYASNGTSDDSECYYRWIDPSDEHVWMDFICNSIRCALADIAEDTTSSNSGCISDGTSCQSEGDIGIGPAWHHVRLIHDKRTGYHWNWIGLETVDEPFIPESMEYMDELINSNYLGIRVLEDGAENSGVYSVNDMDLLTVYNETYLYPQKTLEYNETSSTITIQNGLDPEDLWTLEEISDTINNATIFSYNMTTKTAYMNADNLVFDFATGIKIEDETLIFNGSVPTWKWKSGLYMKILNSTVTSNGRYLRIRSFEEFTLRGRSNGLNSGYIDIIGSRLINIYGPSFDSNYLWMDHINMTNSYFKFNKTTSLWNGLLRFSTSSKYDYDVTINNNTYDIVSGLTYKNMLFDQYSSPVFYNSVFKNNIILGYWRSLSTLINCDIDELVIEPPYQAGEGGELRIKYYLDALAKDSDGNPMSNITLKVVNEADEDTSDDIERMLHPYYHWYWYDNAGGTEAYHRRVATETDNEASIFMTESDGHTPSPGWEKDTIILMDYKRNDTYQTNYTYRVEAYDPNNIWTNVTQTIYPNGSVMQASPLAQVSGVDPNSTWYRPDPNTPTVTIELLITENHIIPNISIDTDSELNITITTWDSDSEGIKVNFTAETTNGNNVNFTVCNLTSSEYHQIRKDASNFRTMLSDTEGCITFNNSIWTEHEFTIEELDTETNPLGCSYNGSATYDSSANTITIHNQTSNLCSIYYDVGNSSVLSYNQTNNTYTIASNMILVAGSELRIENETLKFNCTNGTTCYIHNHGYLRINDSHITAVRSGAHTWIQSEKSGETSYVFTMTNSEMTYIGSAENYKHPIYLTSSSQTGRQPDEPVIISDNIIRDCELAISISGTTEDKYVLVENNEIYNISTGSLLGNAGVITAGGNYNFTFRNNIVHDISSGIHVIWSIGDFNGTFDGNELYSINTSHGIILGKHSSNTKFSNNYIHDSGDDCDGNCITPIINIYNGWVYDGYEYGSTVENNTIENCEGTGIGLYYYTRYGRPNTVRNNRIDNCTKVGIYVLGSSNGHIENNTVSNTQGLYLTSVTYRDVYMMPENMTFKDNTYTTGMDGFYNGDTVNCISVDEKYENFIRADLYVRGDFKAFINTNHTSKLVNIAGVFRPYYYIDVFAADEENNPVDGAIITITNQHNAEYYPINTYGNEKSTIQTKPDGHTPLPEDEINSVAILHYVQNATGTEYFNYTIIAKKLNGSYINDTHIYSDIPDTQEGYNKIYPDGNAEHQTEYAEGNLTDIHPDSTWYREESNTPTNTINITLNLTKNMTYTNWTIRPVESPVIAMHATDTSITIVSETEDNPVWINNTITEFAGRLVGLMRNSTQFANSTADDTGNISFYYTGNFSTWNFSLEIVLYCGDDVCNNGETCATCPIDCGVCPTSSSSSSSGGGSSGSPGAYLPVQVDNNETLGDERITGNVIDVNMTDDGDITDDSESLRERAEALIEEVKKLISEYRNTKDMTEAENKLMEATQAFDNAEYDNAIILAMEAKELVMDAPDIAAQEDYDDRGYLVYILVLAVFIAIAIGGYILKNRRDDEVAVNRNIVRETPQADIQKHKMDEIEAYLSQIRPIVTKMVVENQISPEFEKRVEEIERDAKYAESIIETEPEKAGEMIDNIIVSITETKNEIERLGNNQM